MDIHKTKQLFRDEVDSYRKPKKSPIMENVLLILPLLSFEWEKGKGKTITAGWLKWTYSVAW